MLEASQISFSIIIPTYNRPERLAACLHALVQLQYPKELFEVIVVDDGSSSSLEPVINPFQEQIKITLISQSNAGPAIARNKGAATATNQFLVFTDDDCLPTPDWLQVLATCFATVPTALIGGRTVNLLADNLYSAASQLLIDYLYSYYNAEPGQARFFTSNNFALAKSCFEQIGGFNTTFPLAAGEDREFCHRWLSHAGPMIYAPEAVVYHAHQLTLRSFCRQQFNYGRGAFRFRQVCAERGGQSRLESLAFYLKLLAYPFQQSQQVVLLAALFIGSQAATLTGILAERMMWQTTERSS
jgi:glycosyltransferase involved in cell wall biosynthesis